MESKKKILPEKLAVKFRSKEDLYRLLSFDLQYLLPPYSLSPLHYLRKVLNGEKKMLKLSHVVDMMVPRYNELRVKNIWPLIKDVNDLMIYFPDYELKQLPDRQFMYSILGTFRTEELKIMIEGARKKRALNGEKPADDYIYVEKELYAEISNVMTHKTTKGKTAFLLKKSSKLARKRKQPQRYELQFQNLNREEEKENFDKHDEMD